MLEIISVFSLLCYCSSGILWTFHVAQMLLDSYYFFDLTKFGPIIFMLLLRISEGRYDFTFPHEKINRGLNDNNQCLTDIFKI